jgi:hypothetical protein
MKDIARELLKVAKELVAVDVKDVIDAVREFAFDIYHDPEQGNYSDANDLMDDVVREKTPEGVMGQLKHWGVTRQEFKSFLDGYLKQWYPASEWRMARKDLEKAYRRG